MNQAKILAKTKDTPNINEFEPRLIPTQYEVLYDIENFDYSKGVHEILLSGSVGSSKSLLLAHIAISHCMRFPKARVCIARRTMPDLKRTILDKIKKHMDGALTEGVHYKLNETTASIVFNNGSEIISTSWADRKAKKGRSLELSMLIVEELTENDDIDRNAIMELKMRVNRLPSIPQKLWISATNPDSPAHWAYKYFIESDSETRHVYYSLTSENPFLPPEYIAQLKADLDPKMVERMIYGKWIEIAGEVIYYQYDKQYNFVPRSYELDKSYPIRLCFDFNIGEGKPMSCAVAQYKDDTFHIYNQSVIFSARTEQVLDDLHNRNLLPKDQLIIIHGDAAGSHHDTRSKQTDYTIIKDFLTKHGYKYEMNVPASNPPIRTRHNLVNGYACNSEMKRRLFVYKDAPTADEGFRLVKLKDGGHYIEDDSKHFQHITTAIGYMINWVHLNKNRSQSTTRL